MSEVRASRDVSIGTATPIRRSQHPEPQSLTPANNLTPEQFEFALWLATPSGQRRPTTQKALAKELGVHPVTLSHWKHAPALGDEVVRLTRNTIRAEQVAAILQAQAAIAQTSLPQSTQAARFVFEALGLMGKTGDQPHRPARQVVVTRWSESGVEEGGRPFQDIVVQQSDQDGREQQFVRRFVGEAGSELRPLG